MNQGYKELDNIYQWTHMHTHRCLQCSPNPIWHRMRSCTMQEKEDCSTFQSLFVRGGQDGWREARKLSGRSEAVLGRTHFIEHESFQLSTVATSMHEVSSRPYHHFTPLVPRKNTWVKHTSNLLYHSSDTVQFMITSAVCVIDYTESFLLAKYGGYNMMWFSVQCFESMSHEDGAQCNTSLAPLASSFICVNAGIRILTARDVKLHRLCMCEGVWMCESIYMLMWVCVPV